MNCYDCDREDRTVPATAVCRHCGAAVCTEHAHATTELVTRNAGLGLATLPLPARRITCTTCYDAEHSGNRTTSTAPRPRHRPAGLVGDRR